MATYEDLVHKKVWARLRNGEHPEWQICTVCSIISAGIKLKSARTNELFIIDNNDVRDDVRLMSAFVPWEEEQKNYNGKFVKLLLTICTCAVRH